MERILFPGTGYILSEKIPMQGSNLYKHQYMTNVEAHRGPSSPGPTQMR